MALLEYTDLERQNNITLTTDGRELATAIANSVLAWSAKHCNRLGWEHTTYTEYFSPDYYQDVFYLSALPLDTTQTVTVSTYNYTSNAYDTYSGVVRSREAGIIKTGDCQPFGYEAVRITYTGGYTTLPDDLKQALTELLAQKFDDASNGGKVVTEIRAIDYSEKYDITGKDIPADIMEVLDSYVLPVIV